MGTARHWQLRLIEVVGAGERRARGRHKHSCVHRAAAVWGFAMGWDDGQGRASTPPRAASPFSAARRATTPPRGGGGAADGGLVAPPVAPRPTAQNAGFGGDMPIVIGTVVPHSSTTRLSRAGDELSDAVEFNALQSLRQPRPSDVVIAEPFSEVRICGKYVPRSRAFCCTGCVVVLALCGVFASPVIFGDAESDQGQASPGSSETWSYDDMPLAAEIPASSPHVELELRADLSEMPEGSAARREFEASVITSAAEVMQISKRRIAVLDLRQGSGGRRRQLQSGDSVLVTLGIVPAVEGETSASAAVALLAAAVTMRNDQLSGVLSGAQITASGNMLGEVGEVRLSQVRPCSRGEIPDVSRLRLLVLSGFCDSYPYAAYAAAQREHVLSVCDRPLPRLHNHDGRLPV